MSDTLEVQLAAATSATGIPLDQVKFVFCCLLAYPLGYIFSLISTKNTAGRHFTGMFFGLWFAWFIFKDQMLHSFVSSAIVYLMLQTLPRNVVHKYVFAFMMTYMSISHIYRMYVDYMGWSIDFTGAQMILTIKLITLAFDYSDGMKPKDSLNSYQREMLVDQVPSLLEYFGYVYFFGGFLAGPAFNYKEYANFIDGSLFKSAPGGVMPSSIIPAFSKLGQTLLVGIGVGLQMMYPLSYVREDSFVTNTSFLYRCGYLWFSVLLQRTPYYFAWFLSEGSCIMAGIGFTKYENDKAVWDRGTNVRIIPLETGQSFRDVTENWNIRTDKWLKHYVYERVSSNGVFLTFLVSALWHGFYPGYYLSFMTAAFVTQVARNIRRTIRPRFMEDDEKTPKPTKVYYDIACTITTTMILNYTMAAFVLLGGTYSYKAWSSIFFAGHIVIVLGYFLPLVVGAPRKKKPSTPTETKKTH